MDHGHGGMDMSGDMDMSMGGISMTCDGKPVGVNRDKAVCHHSILTLINNPLVMYAVWGDGIWRACLKLEQSLLSRVCALLLGFTLEFKHLQELLDVQ